MIELMKNAVVRVIVNYPSIDTRELDWIGNGSEPVDEEKDTSMLAADKTVFDN